MFGEKLHEQQQQHQHQYQQHQQQSLPQCYQVICCDQPHHGEPSNTSSHSPTTISPKNFSVSPAATYLSAVPPTDVSMHCCSPPVSFDPECYDCSFECIEVNFPNCSVALDSASASASASPAQAVDCVDCSMAMEEHSTTGWPFINPQEIGCCFEPDCSDEPPKTVCEQAETRAEESGESSYCHGCPSGADKRGAGSEGEEEEILDCCGRICGHQHSWNCGFDKPEAGFDHIFACYHPNTTPFSTPSELLSNQNASGCASPSHSLPGPSPSQCQDPQFHLPYPSLGSSADGPLSALNVLLHAANAASTDVHVSSSSSVSLSNTHANPSEYNFPMDSLTGSLPDPDLSSPSSIAAITVTDGDAYQSYTLTPNLSASPRATPPSDLEPLTESSFMNCQWSDCHETFPSLDELIEHFRTTSSHVPLACLTSTETPMGAVNAPAETMESVSLQTTAAAEEARSIIFQQTSTDEDPFGRAQPVSSQPVHLHCQWGQDHAFTLSGYPTVFPPAHSTLDSFSIDAQQSLDDQLSPNQVDFLLKHLLEEHLTGNTNHRNLIQPTQSESAQGSYYFPNYPGTIPAKPMTSYDMMYGHTLGSALNGTSSWNPSIDSLSSPSSPSSLSSLSLDRSSGKASTSPNTVARISQSHPYRSRTTLPVPCASRPQPQPSSSRQIRSSSHTGKENAADHGLVRRIKSEENDELKAERFLKAEEEHVCGYLGCKKTFSDTASLTDHLNNVHVGSGKDVYQCGWEGCERAMHGPVFKSKQKIMRHLQSHTNHKPFVCELCNQTFSEAATLQQHIRRHSNESCDKAFALIGSLTIHKRTHDGIKPFRCSFCDKSFVEASNLNKHIRTHTGERPHKCEYLGCDKRFARPDQLSRHQNVHRKKEAKALALKNGISTTV
ncbi:zinc finger protein 169 [Phaffia rhodozyma]|uniref:Zinc finger protein 169 n=1 Tax=Phaffia rhodozyma TaxID=264483 RepID=A0A0F7SKC5_PHARH|nr:zinc finger protein 169 [Phaffia rhodozyma]